MNTLRLPGSVLRHNLAAAAYLLGDIMNLARLIRLALISFFVQGIVPAGAVEPAPCRGFMCSEKPPGFQGYVTEDGVPQGNCNNFRHKKHDHCEHPVKQKPKEALPPAPPVIEEKQRAKIIRIDN